MNLPFRLAVSYSLALTAYPQTQILLKAAEVFDANAGRSANFEWTQTVRVAILNAAGREFPGDGFWVRTQSTRLDDGRRCDVVEQWSDGIPVADSGLPLERRCELEAPPLDRDFAMRAVLRYGTVSSLTRTGSDYTVVFSGVSAKRAPADAMARCGSSMRAVLLIDYATSFPKSLSGTVPGGECQVRTTATKISMAALPPAESPAAPVTEKAPGLYWSIARLLRIWKTYSGSELWSGSRTRWGIRRERKSSGEECSSGIPAAAT